MSELYSLDLPLLFAGGRLNDFYGVSCRLMESGRGVRLLVLDLLGDSADEIRYKLEFGLAPDGGFVFLPAASDIGLVFISGNDEYVLSGDGSLLVNTPDRECFLELAAGCSARVLLMHIEYSFLEPFNNGRFELSGNPLWTIASGQDTGIFEIDCSDMGFVPVMERLIINNASDWISRLDAEADAINLARYLFSRSSVCPETSVQATESNIPEELLTIKKTLLNNLERRVPPQDLSDLTGWSVEKTQNEFRRAFGMSVKDFVIRERMAYAASQLKGGSSSVLDISIAAGYSSASAFSVMFRRHYGMSPLKYRIKYGI